MAYNIYPANYNPLGYNHQPSSGIVWVQGETGAKAYPVAPNMTVQLMDSEKDRFYIKSSDASGMPLPLRIFDYTEIKSDPSAGPLDYATKKDIDELRKRIEELAVNKETGNE